MDQLEQATLSGSTVKAERKFEDMIGVLASIFTTPTYTGLTGDDGTASADLKFKATTQRMIRMMKLSKGDMTAKQTEKAVLKLTDAEKLAILSNASLKGPLGRYPFEEMQRLFLRVKGEKAYRLVFGDEDPPEAPMWFNLWEGK